MKKTQTASMALAAIGLLVLIAGVSASYAYTITNEAPLSTINTGGSHPLIFSETTFSNYGSETDNLFGTNYFSLQLNGYVTYWIPQINAYVIYGYQPVLKYIGGGSDFQFYPQIQSAILPTGWPVSTAWSGQKVYSPTITPSQLVNYEYFQAVNGGSTFQTVTVGCNTQIIIPAESMYVGIIKLSNCSVFWSDTQSFPSSFVTGFASMQVGALGLGTNSNGQASKASFTATVLHTEEFEVNCAYSGCTYSFSNVNGTPGYTAETSNLTYVINPDSGGHHLQECQESPDENVC